MEAAEGVGAPSGTREYIQEIEGNSQDCSNIAIGVSQTTQGQTVFLPRRKKKVIANARVPLTMLRRPPSRTNLEAKIANDKFT